MFIAMNRFKIVKGQEESFERIWKSRTSRLSETPGYIISCTLRMRSGRRSKISWIGRSRNSSARRTRMPARTERFISGHRSSNDSRSS
jgi:hypothetical protein